MNCGGHDDADTGIGTQKLGKGGQAIHHRHFDVQHDHVHVGGSELLDCKLAILDHRIFRFRQHHGLLRRGYAQQDERCSRMRAHDGKIVDEVQACVRRTYQKYHGEKDTEYAPGTLGGRGGTGDCGFRLHERALGGQHAES